MLIIWAYFLHNNILLSMINVYVSLARKVIPCSLQLQIDQE